MVWEAQEDTKVVLHKTGFKMFSNMRAVMVRPNSSFMDLDLRYSFEPSAVRLKKVKRMTAMNLYMSEIKCCVWVIVILAVLSTCTYFFVRHRSALITFPRLENK